MNFAEYFRNTRIKNGLTLRAFCNKYGFDTAYISRIETGKMLPPNEDGKLEALAKALNIEKNSPEWVEYHDLAYQAKSEISKDIKESVPELINLLPAFLRTPDNKKINKEKVKQLINFLKER